MTNPSVSLYEAFKRQHDLCPFAAALYYQGKRFSYARVMRMADAFAAALESLGVGPYEPVTICLPNIPQAVAAFYAVSRIGAIAHLVHPLAPQTQLLSFIHRTGSRTVLLLTITAKNYPVVLEQNRVILCDPAGTLNALKRGIFAFLHRKDRAGIKKRGALYSFEALTKKYAAVPSRHYTGDPHTDAIYLHSGGTGGEPKTIALSAYAVNTLCYEGKSILGVEDVRGKKMLSVLPMFHGFGLAMGLHAMLINGGTNTICPKFRTKEAVRLINSGKVNYIIGVPAMYEALLKSPGFIGKGLKNLQLCFVGGDFVSQNLLDRFNAHLLSHGSEGRLFEGYGLTETVTVCAVNTLAAHRPGSVGKPLQNVSIRAFCGEEPLPEGAEGELCIAGDQLMNGYLHMREATDAVFFEHNGRRYVRTGDLGHVDADGFCYFKSREKRMVKVSGIPVFPSEIEHLTARLLPDVRDVCAFDVPDDKTGAALVLCVTLSNNSQNRDAAAFRRLAETLTGAIAESLSLYAVPKKILLYDRLPQTAVGKVDSLALRAEFLRVDTE